MGDKGMAFALGALGGGVAAFAVWQLVSNRVNAQVTDTINSEVPAAVRTEVNHQFATLGITPNMATQVRTLLNNLDQLHVLDALAQATTVRR
jgi:hypothetical protein